MPRKHSHITVTDQFCGAGGSSQGVRNLSNKNGGGINVELALNHWALAIETHNTNFPNTRHECTDISACDPRRYPSTDILITSPECTNHSLAKGIKAVQKQMDLFATGRMDAAAERSRSTMWDVCRFAEFHKYNIIIVENVVDARKWIMFDTWLNAMYVLGYQHKCIYLNSMHCHPTPQSRDRMYIVFWKKCNKAPMLDYTPEAHCPSCNHNIHAVQTWKHADKKFGKYKQQYVYCCPKHGVIVEPYYYAAFNIIDWSKKGKRIGDRKKPLSDNTQRRINAGLEKHKNEPFIVNDQQSTGINFRVKSTLQNLPTIPTAHNLKIITPFIIKGEHTQQEGMIRRIDGVMQTQVTRQSMSLVMPPFIIENKGKSTIKSITSASPCLTTVGHLGILTNEAFNSFIHYNRQQNTTHISQPIQTVATVEQLSVVNFVQPKIEDCYYRMLVPMEVQLAMAFNKDYIICGSGKDKVKQCGNAVTPPAMEWIVEQCVISLN